MDLWDRINRTEDRVLNEKFKSFDEALDWIHAEDAEKRRQKKRLSPLDKVQEKDLEAREKKKPKTK